MLNKDGSICWGFLFLSKFCLENFLFEWGIVKFWSGVECILEGDISRIGIDVKCSMFSFELDFDVMGWDTEELFCLIWGVLVSIGLLGIDGRVVLSKVLILEVWKEGCSNVLVLKGVAVL